MTSANPPYPYFNNITYNSAFFETNGVGLTVSEANAKYLQKTVPDTALALETFIGGVQTDLIKSNGGFGGTIYTDPGVGTQTYVTLVCQNNSACSFGGSAGTCNLGALSSGVNIGFNMPTGNQITIGTAPIQDTNILIATKGAIVSGTNKIQIGASTNALNIVCGTITIGTGNSAINIGSYSLQTSNILIGTKGAFVPGTNKVVIGDATNTLYLSCGVLYLSAPISPLYNYSSFSPIGSTGIGNIGEVISATYSAITFSTSGLAVGLGTLTGLAQGHWILTGEMNVNITSSTVSTVKTFWTNNTTATSFAIQQFGTQTGSNTFGITNNTSYYVSGTSALTLQALFIYTGTAPNSISTAYRVYATRIA